MAWPTIKENEVNALLEIVRSESDRVVAILGGSFLDSKLGDAIISRMRSGRTVEMLFGLGKALGELNNRIQLGYLLYMYEKQVHQAMIGIYEIRNLFAHQLQIGSFTDNHPKLVAAFDKCKLHIGNTHYPPFAPQVFGNAITPSIIRPESLRDVFMVNLQFCLRALERDILAHMPNSNHPIDWSAGAVTRGPEPIA